MSDKFNICGKPHSVMGESSSDLILRTKGNIKIQWGNKFIDLIKDGKINVNADFIYQSDSIGIKDGIYIIDGQVILKFGNTEIDLTKESENTYVSYLIEQKTSPEQKYQALTNIGFIYNDLDSITEDSLRNGITYVESEQKLYIVKDGELTEYSFKLPNPYPEQFVIAKNDPNIGALVIKGEGINNSVSFNSFKIYSDLGSFTLNSDNKIVFKIKNSDIITINQDKTIIDNNVVSNYFESPNATSFSGFRLYMSGSESTLEVDNLIVRNKYDNLYPIYPSIWFQYQNIITSVKSTSEDEDTKNTIQFNLKYINRYIVDDIVHVFIDLEKTTESEDTVEVQQSIILYKVIQSDKQSIQVEFIDTITPNPIESLQPEELYTKLQGKTIFLRNTNKQDVYLNSSTNDGFTWYNGYDIINYNTLGRLGNLSSLTLLGTNNKEPFPITGNGVYGETGTFVNALYTSDYVLEENDDSSRLASTEWVNKRDEILKEEIQGSLDDIISSVNNANLDLYFDNKIASTYTTKRWITSNEEFKKVIGGATEKTQVISCKYGQLTLQKVGELVHIVAWVAAVTDDNNTSHRSFEFNVDPSTYDITGLSTYILFTRYPGYYLSKSKSENSPVNFYYVGTSKQDPTKYYPYLWNWNGISWSLIDTYVEDTQEYIFIRSTNTFQYQVVSEGKYYNLPSGFICYVNSNGDKEVGFGKSNYIPGDSSRDAQITKDRLQALKNMITSPVYNIKPNNNNYPYLWYILKGDDMTDHTKWVQLSSESIQSTLSSDCPKRWGNCSVISPIGYNLFKTDSSGKIIGTDIGINFKLGIGSTENWKDKIWVESFIRYCLAWILHPNKNFYNPITGWNFKYDEGFFTGSGGYIHIYFSEPIPPSSDNSSDLEYYPQMRVYQIGGTVNGYGYSSEFQFNNLKIGKLIENVGMGQDLDIGDYCPFNNFLYQVSFSGYYAKVVDFENKKEEIIVG